MVSIEANKSDLKSIFVEIEDTDDISVASSVRYEITSSGMTST